MKLTDRVLEKLAEMVVGDHPEFPYRSSQYITRFFKRRGLAFVHDGSTRRMWAQERLAELNLGTSQSLDLPPEDLVQVITELFDSDDFERHNENQDARIRESPMDEIPPSHRPLDLLLRPSEKGQDRLRRIERRQERLPNE